ncbi:MAG TPA: alpha/beta hydrolase [Gemmataceae bacterium]|nr:alpha/beta hydrolase [Gemmataceae bacterium]
MLYCRALVFLFCLAAVAPAADDAPVSRPAPIVMRGITYATVGGEKLLLDVAMPKGGGPHPCVVCYHGGGWRGGNRRDLSIGDKDASGKVGPSVIESLAAEGYVAVSAAYRLAPKSKFPAQIEDAKTAIRFLRENAKQYDIDPDRVGVAGFSAGGHLALLAGLADKSAGLEGTLYADQSSEVKCVVSFFGPTDLSLYATSPGLEEGYMVPFLGKECKLDGTVYKKASPIEYVTKKAPPVLMIHGTFDVIVPILHSERLLKKLQDAGTTAELVTVPGGGHGWGGTTMAKTTRDALKFLGEHLKGQK